jgi:hypothetical protein
MNRFAALLLLSLPYVGGDRRGQQYALATAPVRPHQGVVRAGHELSNVLCLPLPKWTARRTP